MMCKKPPIFSGGYFYRYRIFILVKSLFCLSNSPHLDKYYQYYAIYELVEILKYDFGICFQYLLQISITIAKYDGMQVWK